MVQPSNQRNLLQQSQQSLQTEPNHTTAAKQEFQPTTKLPSDMLIFDLSFWIRCCSAVNYDSSDSFLDESDVEASLPGDSFFSAFLLRASAKLSIPFFFDSEDTMLSSPFDRFCGFCW